MAPNELTVMLGYSEGLPVLIDGGEEQVSLNLRLSVQTLLVLADLIVGGLGPTGKEGG
jgi:hypothetical protein